jgi:hypothetical protein
MGAEHLIRGETAHIPSVWVGRPIHPGAPKPVCSHLHTSLLKGTIRPRPLLQPNMKPDEDRVGTPHSGLRTVHSSFGTRTTTQATFLPWFFYLCEGKCNARSMMPVRPLDASSKAQTDLAFRRLHHDSRATHGGKRRPQAWTMKSSV